MSAPRQARWRTLLASLSLGCGEPPAPERTPAPLAERSPEPESAATGAASAITDTASAATGAASAITDTASAATDAAVDDLIAHAARLRARLDFATLPAWSARSGADPFALVEDGARTLGLLRRGRVVVLGPHGETTAHAATIPGATTLRRIGDTLVIAAEGRGTLHVLDAATLAVRAQHHLEGVASIRAIEFGADERRLYLADPHRHRVLQLAWPPEAERVTDVTTIDDSCAGAHSVARRGRWLVANCRLDHRLTLRRVGDDGRLGERAVVEHDGPLWSVAAATDRSGSLHLLAGGVEDHPLDRSDGAFGYIDSFVFVYRAEDTPAGLKVAPRHRLNVSAHGVITPKHVRWTSAPERAVVTGYGSDAALDVEWPADASQPARIRRHTLAPGITDGVGSLERGVFASPLLDAWIVTAAGEPPRVVAVLDPGDDRTASERLGEALAFTGLMAPRAVSEGRRSRFTCETCHFEGRTDGRTHWTGRDDVHATTKTLRGLLNNRPHFSRALDPTTAGMVHSEFRVANAGTDADPWFSLTRADAPWLDALGAPPDPLDPITLRRALVDFLAAFTPEPNPAARGQAALTPAQARGARAFERHCESCHRARLISDDPGSAIAPEHWARHILHPAGGIVWGSEARAKTGVEPYVHPEGPRAPSLRRLWVKRPLLTNGRARTVADVLADVRVGPDAQGAVHGGGPGRALTAEEQRALAAFLDLL